MIGMKETGELPIHAGVAGNLTTSSVAGPFLNPLNDALALKGVIARLGTAGGTQATIVDILRNGSSIFASGKINFATSSTTPTYGPLTTNPTVFSKGDEIKITVTQVGSGAVPADLAIALLFCKPFGTKYPSAMITDGF